MQVVGSFYGEIVMESEAKCLRCVWKMTVNEGVIVCFFPRCVCREIEVREDEPREDS